MLRFSVLFFSNIPFPLFTKCLVKMAGGLVSSVAANGIHKNWRGLGPNCLPPWSPAALGHCQAVWLAAGLWNKRGINLDLLQLFSAMSTERVQSKQYFIYCCACGSHIWGVWERGPRVPGEAQNCLIEGIMGHFQQNKIKQCHCYVGRCCAPSPTLVQTFSIRIKCW